MAVVLGTERRIGDALRITAMVVDGEETLRGWQDKVQLDPSEEGVFSPGTERQVFRVGPLSFGVAICHEGWRYPETVRWAAGRGAHVVFHPHFGEAEPGAYRPTTFMDPANTFPEKAIACRAAENTCYLASVNCGGKERRRPRRGERVPRPALPDGLRRVGPRRGPRPDGAFTISCLTASGVTRASANGSRGDGHCRCCIPRRRGA